MIEKLQSVDIDIIKSELEILPKFKTIICLQCSKETKETSDAIIDPRYPGMKNYLKEKYNTTFDPNDFKYPLFDMPYINSIMESLKMVNSRVLNLKTTACHIIIIRNIFDPHSFIDKFNGVHIWIFFRS